MKNREQIEEYVITLMRRIDRISGNNAERYVKLFKSMSNAQFNEFMIALRDGTTQLNVILPNNLSKVSTNDVMELATERKVSVFSKIYFYDISSGRRYLTKYKYLVITLPVRRLSQYLFHKISLPDSDQTVNPITGQVIPPDKGASLSAVETQVLASKGLETSIVELLKIRGGDTTAYRAMKFAIEEDGESLITDIPLTNRPRSTETAELYFHAMMIDGTF